MPPTASYDWIYSASGYSLAAAGLLLLLWSLFYDHPRGRRRCPKCWYDMGGVPGLTCPECGREARSERRLHRTRRHRRLAALSLLVAAAGLAVTAIPDYQIGWQHALPSWALVFLAPARDPTVQRFALPPPRATLNYPSAVARIQSAPPVTPPKPAGPSIGHTLTQELWSRLE